MGVIPSSLNSSIGTIEAPFRGQQRKLFLLEKKSKALVPPILYSGNGWDGHCASIGLFFLDGNRHGVDMIRGGCASVSVGVRREDQIRKRLHLIHNILAILEKGPLVGIIHAPQNTDVIGPLPHLPQDIPIAIIGLVAIPPGAGIDLERLVKEFEKNGGVLVFFRELDPQQKTVITRGAPQHETILSGMVPLEMEIEDHQHPAQTYLCHPFVHFVPIVLALQPMRVP